jgi:hypothetical protein
VSVRILRVSIDTLEENLEIAFPEGLPDELDELKRSAQLFDFPQRFRDSALFMEPKSISGWRWRLTCPDFSIVLSLATVEPGDRPNGQIRLSAFGLSTRPTNELLVEALEAAGLFGECKERNLARLDVCADVQGWVPSEEEMLGIACPAVDRAINYCGRHPQTFRYGSTDLRVRVYDKTAQAAKKHIAWIRSVWAECEGYDPAEPVTRVESQMRTKTLKELRLFTAADALERGGAAFEWALREWCQLRVPTGDKKVTRWPEHPVWTQIREATLTTERCERARRRATMLPLETAAKRLIGLAALSAAHYGDSNYMKALQRLSDLAESRMLTEHIDFDRIVREKRKRLEAELGLDPIIPF